MTEKERNTAREESSKSRDSIMQTTDSRPLRHHFPAFDVSLHSCSDDEQERGGCGGEKAMKRQRRAVSVMESIRPRSLQERRFDDATVYSTWRLLPEGVGMERRGAERDGGGCGRDA